MDPNFISFSVELGTLFPKKLTENEIKDSFERFLDLTEFNGVKKIYQNDRGETEAKLTTSDNSFEALLSEQDFVIKYVNKRLKKILKTDIERFRALFTKTHDLLPTKEYEVARYSHTIISTDSKIITQIGNSVISNTYRDAYYGYTVSLQFEDDQSLGSSMPFYVDVTTEHTSEMHRVFTSLNRKADLNNMVIIKANLGLTGKEGVSLNDFIDRSYNYCQSSHLPRRLGYDEE